MRLLIVTQYFWPENFRINDLAAGLRERGHEVTVYTGKPNYPDGRFFDGYGFFGRGNETYEGMRVIRVPLIPRGDGGAVRLALNYLSFALFASALAPFRVRGEFDAILVYEPSPVTVGLPALVMKKLKRAPILFWVQDLWPESFSATEAVRAGWILKAVERLVRFIYRGCDRLLVQSRGFIPQLSAMGAPAEKIRYFPSWAEGIFNKRHRGLGLPFPQAGNALTPRCSNGRRAFRAFALWRVGLAAGRSSDTSPRRRP